MKKKCPRCGIKQNGSVECEICGLIFDTFESAKDEKTRGSPKFKYYFFLIVILAAGMVFWLQMKPDSIKSAVIGKIRWITDYHQGLSVAKENSQPVMLFFAASWCGSCKSIINTVFSNKRVVQASEKLIPIYVDVDQNRQIMANYKIRGVPTVYILDHQGLTVMKLEGPYDTQTYKNAIDKITVRYTTN